MAKKNVRAMFHLARARGRAHTRVYRPRAVKFTPSHFRNEWPGSRINARNILFYNPQVPWLAAGK